LPICGRPVGLTPESKIFLSVELDIKLMIADIYINKNGVLIQFLLVLVSPILVLFL